MSRVARVWKTGGMRVLLVAAVATAFAAPAVAAPGSATDFPVDRARHPVSLLKLQTELLKQRRWADLYQSYSPRFRRQCPFAPWRAELDAAWPQVRTANTVGIRATIRGNRARVTYRLVLAGKVVDRATAASPDIYVRIGNRWYDELDGHTGC